MDIIGHRYEISVMSKNLGKHFFSDSKEWIYTYKEQEKGKNEAH